MKESSEKEIVYSKSVIEFITVAHEYCLFVEKAESYPKEDILEYMLKIIPLIYLKGALLPSIDEDLDELPERFVNEEHWEKAFGDLKTKLDIDDLYYDTTVNDRNEREVLQSSIAENLTDVYQDLKDFVMLYQKNTIAAKLNAVAECSHLFETNWGLKIISAHKAIHQLVHKANEEEEEF
jgi:hypothetical protein